MYPSAPIASSTHVVVVAVIGVVDVADLASRTITWCYCMLSDTIETI